jgi:hypothetical protein
MKRVTRSVTAEALRDLLEHPPRAALAFVRDGAIEAVPATFRLVDGRYLFAVDGAAGPLPAKAKLVIATAPVLRPPRHVDARSGDAVQAPAGETTMPSGTNWRRKTVAWHYGEMRQA